MKISCGVRNKNMATVTVKCPYCESIEVICYGKSIRGTQRYKFKHCGKIFQLEYKNKACKPGVHKVIIDMVMNSSGVLDTSKTVSRVLAKSKDVEYSRKLIALNICILVHFYLLPLRFSPFCNEYKNLSS